MRQLFRRLAHRPACCTHRPTRRGAPPGRCASCWSARSCCRSRCTPWPRRSPITSTSTMPATACAAISRSCTSTRRRCSRPSSSPRAISTRSPATSRDEQIRANEAAYSERLRAMTASLPQLRDLWIVGADGYPLVSGTVFPMPRIDLSDRDYFKAHNDNPVNGALRQPRCWTRARRQHPLLRDQPQARDQRPVRRRHHRFDRAGIFQRILFAAAAARDRGAAARRRRGAGPLSGRPRRADAPAGRTRRS